MRLELDPNSTTILHPETLEQQSPAEPGEDSAAEHLKEGIRAARAGDRSSARHELLRAAELDPQNEAVWLWLSSISEYPEQLLTFLTRVLEINPSNERAIEWAAATNALLAKSFVQRGIDAAESGQHDIAESHFQRALQHDDNSSVAWLWLASLSQEDDQRIMCFEKVLEIEPGNEMAANGINETRDRIREQLLSQARDAALHNRPDECAELLNSITETYPDWTEAWLMKAHAVSDFQVKLEAFRKVLELDPENPAAKAGTESIEAIFSATDSASETDEPAEVIVDAEQSAAAWPEPAEEAAVKAAEPANEEWADTDAAPIAEPNRHEAVTPAPEWAADDGSRQAEITELQADEPDGEEIAYELDETDFSFEQVSYDGYAAEQVVDDPEADEAVPQPGNGFDYFVEETKDAGPAWAAETQFSSETGDSGQSLPQTLVSIDIDDETRAAILGYSLGDQAEAAEGEAVPAPHEPFEGSEEPSQTEFDTTADNVIPFSNGRSVQSEQAAPCPFCDHLNDVQTFTCPQCQSVLTLSDLELLLANQNADTAVLRQAVESMERNGSDREFDEKELWVLGIGHLNLRNLQFGYNYLREASQKNPNDVVLSSQVNALLIRLEEIKEQEAVHNAMVRGKTILVVDDSPTVRKLISGKLEKCGHEVHCSSDGEEAINKLEELRPDLILLDINMPRMDGYQACKLIRNNPATKDVPVVMISGKDGFFDKVRGRMVGTSGYITKPFGPEALMKAVEFYLNPNA
ncbi:MAG: response regulator [Pyrinomonadaceae bacterium]